MAYPALATAPSRSKALSPHGCPRSESTTTTADDDDVNDDDDDEEYLDDDEEYVVTNLDDSEKYPTVKMKGNRLELELQSVTTIFEDF